MKKYLTLPNILTVLRMIGAVCLLLLEPFSTLFFLVFTLSGISDALDGWIARATGTTSELGSKLDSAADLLFYVVTMLRILPTLYRLLPGWIWFWVGTIVLLRAALYLTVAVRFHRFASIHTYLNKMTGFSIFLLPYFTATSALFVYSIVVCVVSSLSTTEEWALHLTSKTYSTDRKTILPLSRHGA